MEVHNTDNFQDNDFSPHGQISFSAHKDGIVVYRALGPFNYELIKVFERMEFAVLKELKQRVTQWHEIVIFEESCLATPEFFNELAEYLIQMKNQGLSPLSSVFVLNNTVEGAMIMKNQYQKIYHNAGIPFSIVKTEEEALNWSTEQLNNQKHYLS